MFKIKSLIAVLLVLTIVFTSVNIFNIEAKANSVEDIDTQLAPYIDIIHSVADEYYIAPEFIEAMIWVESKGDAKASSKYGAKGLMQIIPKWHKDRMKRLGVTDLYNPEQNIRVGCDYLLELFEEYEDIYLVLMCYNEGESKSTINKFEKGNYSDYAKNIVELSDKLQDLHYDDPEPDLDLLYEDAVG